MRGSILLLLAAAAAAGSTQASAQRVRPVVDARDGYLLGVVVNGAWRNAERGASLVRGGEQYRVFAGGRAVGVFTGARPEPGEPCDDARFVKLTPEVEDADVAVVGTWNVRPRAVTAGDAANPAYAADVRRMARAHGIANPEVRITGVVRADLDGDGTEEAIVSATRAQEAQLGWAAHAGDYSMVFVRKLVRGVVRTIVLEETYHPRSSPTAVPWVYDLGGVYDLDGDGAYEIVLRGRYYEGASTGIYRIRGITADTVAESGCGA
jgi:pyruvate/2-oxoglutarate dehydrogenase complex dihydrolipoamide acyltransferase (E2) component